MAIFTLIRVENLESKKEYYYSIDGSEIDTRAIRVKKQLYILRHDMADRYSCLHTKTKGKYRRQYITVQW